MDLPTSPATNTHAAASKAAAFRLRLLRRVAECAIALLLTTTGVTQAQDDVNPTPPSSTVPVNPASTLTQTVYQPATTPPVTTVPNVIGKTREYATALILRSRLEPAQTGEKDSTEPRGTVLGTSPDAGTKVRAGTTVGYVVASGMNTVPDVRRRTPADAAAELRKAGFRAGQQSERFDRERPGLVIAQSPAPRTLAELDTAVALVVSKWPQVPKIVGLPEQTAIDHLRQVALQPASSGTEPSSLPQGAVLRSDPEAGATVPPKSRVRYWLASGQNRVPDLRGQPRANALRIIDAAGFGAGSLDQRADLGDPNLVLTQAPAAGALAKLGTPVSLVLSKVLLMPDIVGESEADARAMLANIALAAEQSGQAPSLQAKGTVLSSDPIAGARVDADTVASYTVASGQYRVPELVGTDAQRAHQLIADSGFAAGQFSARPMPDRIGQVLEQTPAAGTLAPLGSPVSVVIASEYPLVPNVVGQPEGDAVERLKQAGFTPTRSGTDSSVQSAGTVLQTQPPAGASAAPGSQVGYRIASGNNVIPDVIGKPATDSRELIAEAGFQRGQTQRRFAPESLGQVLEQNPPPGTLAPLQTPIATVVGSDQTIVPYLVGMELDDARDALSPIGLATSDPVPRFTFSKAGTVVAQSPAAGSPAGPGDVVELHVARAWLGMALGSTMLLTLAGGAWWTQLKPWPIKPPIDVDSSLAVGPAMPPEGLSGTSAPAVALQVTVETEPPSEIQLPITGQEVRDE